MQFPISKYILPFCKLFNLAIKINYLIMTLTLTDRVYFYEQLSYLTFLVWIYGLKDIENTNSLLKSGN